MAQGVTIEKPLDLIREKFSFSEQDPRVYSSLNLAFLGDAVYELMIRTVIFHTCGGHAGALSKKTEGYVNAKAQAKLARAILPLLTNEEKGVYRRGRNAKPSSVPKHQSLADYHRATGLEALYGYLYLEKKTERLIELTYQGLHFLETKNGGKEEDYAE